MRCVMFDGRGASLLAAMVAGILALSACGAGSLGSSEDEGGR